MEARSIRALVVLAVAMTWPAVVSAAVALRTPNFVVHAPTPELAREIGEAAEHWRKVLAIDWIGTEMPTWTQPCPIVAKVAPNLGAGGATTFVFDRGEVFGWEMNIQGSRERVLDSVLPHEITHTIFACYFRRPLPRWADEGACTTVEDRSEIEKQERLLITFLKTGKGIPFDQMFAMREYPADVLPLYAQGHSLTRYLLMRRDKQTFLAFIADGMEDENWPRALQKHYGHDNLYALQMEWLDWVRQGRPELGRVGTAIAATQPQSVSLPNSAMAVPPVTVAANVVPHPVGEPRQSAYARAANETPGVIRDASVSSAAVWR